MRLAAAYLYRYLSVSVLLLTSASCICSRESRLSQRQDDQISRDLAMGFQLDHSQAQRDLAELTREPHPFGSSRQAWMAQYLEQRLQQGTSLDVKRQSFQADTPNPAALAETSGPIASTISLNGYNIIGSQPLVDKAPCVIALASHYDTKIVPGMRYVGANDSGSSTVLLLQQLAYLRAQRSKADSVCDIIGIFFDGEEAVLEDWNDGLWKHPAKIQDNTYGSRHLASKMAACTYAGKAYQCLPQELGGQPLVALILMDMLGSPNMRISRDTSSSPELVTLAAQAAKAIGHPDIYAKPETAQSIADDHIPFRQIGVAAIDLIDFQNLEHWHTHGDELENLSLPNMEIAGRLALYMALQLARQDKVDR